MDTKITVVQPKDLDPAFFVIDSVSKLIGLAPSALDSLTSNNTDVEYTTSANVSGQTALMFLPGSAVEQADPTSAFIYCGVSLTAASSGAQVVARRLGILVSDTWNWTPHLPIFVGLQGLLTQTPPTSGYSLIIGYALDAQTAFLSPEHLIYIQGTS